MLSYANSDAIASTQWVADHLNDPQVRLIEIVYTESPWFGMPGYLSGHIPGALAWDFEKDLQDPVRKDLRKKSGFEALLSRSGITPETTVVVYSALNNLIAAYAIWEMKIFGHKNVRLLDGDKEKWLREKRPTTSEVPKFAPAMYKAQEPDWSLRINREDILRSIGKKGTLPVDTRSVEMYNGLNNAGCKRAGHIPGAVNLAALPPNPDGPYKGWHVPTVNSDGTFKSAEELHALFDGLGITPDKEYITYCVGGGLSSHAWFTLTQLMGYPNVREYDRSWREWGNREDTPMEP